MSRPLRIEFPGALYHVVSRGHRQQAIYEDDSDRRAFLELLAEAVERFNWRCYAYCQMNNHYHLLVRTAKANLSAGMRHLNGVYTQTTNRRHRRVGCLFQGRYKAVLVDPDKYLLPVGRHIVLNPVRAGATKVAGAWRWSSYRATVGDDPTPTWLAARELLEHFADDPREARKQYYVFVLNGVRERNLWSNVRQQLYLGDDEFIRKVQAHIENPDDPNVPQIQRRPPAPSLDDISQQARTKNEAIEQAYRTQAYSLTDIARFFGMHPSTVSRIVRQRGCSKPSNRAKPVHPEFRSSVE